MPTRQTLTSPATLSGIGLFTAKPAQVTLRPNPDLTGIHFQTTIPGTPTRSFPAHISALQHLPQLPGRNTILGASHKGPFAITTEHILSALAGLGITDAHIDLVGIELPMFDGSAADFCAAISTAGTQPTTISATPITLREPITIEGPAGASITATPSDTTTYTYNLDYTGTPGASRFAPQSATWDNNPASYLTQIAPARTFCLLPEAQALRAAGLFHHVGPKDMLVLDESGHPIDNQLRFPNEPARHKLLDLIGDLALAGRPIQAHITATRAGHALNHQLAQKLSCL
ncbi:MAG: UDP-3-O-acyl-N-acetylglucosamine deacetylase [Phycisphaerales bacterium]|nr:UDP-3-O-acyl-N-acetylglucosamine deacetylase [Phycisphaerales bacterium]